MVAVEMIGRTLEGVCPELPAPRPKGPGVGAGAVLGKPGAAVQVKAHQDSEARAGEGGTWAAPCPPAALPTAPAAQNSGFGVPKSGTCCAWVHEVTQTMAWSGLAVQAPSPLG